MSSYRQFADFGSLKDITEAVDAGHTVCWQSEAYQVRYNSYTKRYDVVCLSNKNAQGLFWLDGINSEFKPDQFFRM
jgi:hypothetical protein